MDFELVIKDRDVTQKSLEEYMCAGSEVTRLCLPPSLMNRCEELKNHVEMYALIDFPQGLSHINTRQQEMIYAARSGAKGIDLTLNVADILDFRSQQIIDDLEGLIKICKEYSMIPRAIIEYPLLEEYDASAFITQMISTFKLAGVITSTGTIMADVDEDIIDTYCLLMGQNSVFTCSAFTDQRMRQYSDMGVSGFRFFGPKMCKNMAQIFENGV